MVGRDEGKLVLWPHYFDKSLSRARGRRVPASLATENPRAHEIAQACKTLGFKPELEEDARPPGFWHERKGRVLIPKTAGKKEEVLKQVARRL